MRPPSEPAVWAPQRLKARLAALKGLAPAPTVYAIWRATTRAGEAEKKHYHFPDDPSPHGDVEFGQWLVARGLAGAEQLSVSVLVIREHLDEAGLIREGVLERRRGDAEGPYFGNVARVEFTGAAKLTRRYRATRDGRLIELPPQDDTGVAPPLSEDDLTPESYAGDDAAVRAYFGSDTIILDRRPPSLFEELLGLGTILHVRRPDGAEPGCGVGWHGSIAFVLAGDFPRHGQPAAAPPELESAVERAVRTRHLIRYETRLDEKGFGVIAGERGRRTLVSIRLDGKTTRIEPYVPGRNAAMNDDQRRWLAYAETYEARVILDLWRNGDTDEIVVLTIDPDQEAWRHIIDADGVEVSRLPDNDAAAAALYRARLNPPDEAPGPVSAPPQDRPTELLPVAAATPPDEEAPPESFLAWGRAWSRVTELLDEIAAEARSGPKDVPNGAPHGAPHGVPQEVPQGGPRSGGRIVPDTAVSLLHELLPPLTLLNAAFSAGSARRLIAQLEGGVVGASGFAAAVDGLVICIRDELSLTRVVVLPTTTRPAGGEQDFGPLVDFRFPEAAYDIAEAVHCLALRRPTAAVLHAMRVMRRGVRGLATVLSLPVQTQPIQTELTQTGITQSGLAQNGITWTSLIAAVRRLAGDHRDIIDALSRVRRAWRAPGLLPADKYTEEEAEAVLAAVEAFMRLVAAKSQEPGDPEEG